MEKVEFTIPLHLVSPLNGSHGHWRRDWERRRGERAATRLAWYAAGQPKLKTPAAITLTRVAPREFDDDNLRGSMKSVRDELCEIAGVKDGPRAPVSFLYDQRKPDAPRQAWVEVSWCPAERAKPKRRRSVAAKRVR